MLSIRPADDQYDDNVAYSTGIVALLVWPYYCDLTPPCGLPASASYAYGGAWHGRCWRAQPAHGLLQPAAQPQCS